MLAAPASASAFKLTHRLKVSVEYRYEWSLSPDRPDCARSGSGFLRGKVSTRSLRVLAEQNRSAGRFVMLVPYGRRGTRELGPRRLLGSYQVANNAPWVGECAAENNASDTERTGCGTKRIPRRAQVLAASTSRRRIKVDDGNVSGPLGNCNQPGVTGIDDLFRPASIKSPSKRQLRRRSFTLEGRQSVRLDLDDSGVGTGTVVRTVRLAFRKL
jgi:hypothetical protein